MRLRLSILVCLLALVSTAALSVDIPVGLGPARLAIDTTANRLYVSDRDSDTISVIDLDHNTVIATIPVGDSPHSAALTPDGQLLLVTHYLDGSLGVVDTASNTLMHTIPLTPWPQRVSVTPDGSEAWVSTAGPGGVVHIVDLVSWMVETIDPAPGLQPDKTLFHPNGMVAFLGVSNVDPYVYATYVLDVPNRTVTNTIPGFAVEDISPDASVGWGRKVTPNGVGLLDLVAHRVVTQTTVNARAGLLAAGSCGVYVPNDHSDTVTVLDAADLSEITVLTGFQGPDQVVIHPGLRKVYVSNLDGGTVTVLDDLAACAQIAAVPSRDAVAVGSQLAVCVEVDPRPAGILGSYGATLAWDPNTLQYLGSAGGDAPFDTPVVNDGDAATGTLAFSDASTEGSPGPTKVACFEFGVHGATGDSAALDITLTSLFNTDFVNIAANALAVDAQVELHASCLVGDPNGDTAINSGDALLILAHGIGLPIPVDAVSRLDAGCGDVNADGFTDSTDANIVLSYEVGLPIDPVFPMGNSNQTTDTCDTAKHAAPKAGLPWIQPALDGARAWVETSTVDPTTIDVSVFLEPGADPVGSYTAELRWDPRLVRFDRRVGGSDGIAAPLINPGGAEDGVLRFAAADPNGTVDGARLVTFRFTRGQRVDPEQALTLSFQRAASVGPSFRPVTISVQAESARTAGRRSNR